MASDKFQTMIVSMVLIVLIIFLAVGFVSEMTTTYDIDDTSLRDRLRYDQITDVLNDTDETAENWRDKFEDQNIFSIVAGIVVTGIFGIGKQMFEFIITPYNILALILVDILKIPSIVFNVIIFLLIVASIFGLWAVLKKGD